MRKSFTLIISLMIVLTMTTGAMAKPGGGRGQGNSNSNGNGSPAVVEKNNLPSHVVEKKEMKEEQRANQYQEPVEQLGSLGEQETLKPVRGFLKVKGQHPVFDVPPVIREGRTLIPVRAITQGLGAELDWDPDTKTVTITRGETTIVLTIGSNEVLVNGETVTIELPASLISNRTFVPLRFISEALGERVDYDPETGDIEIGDDDDSEDPSNEDGIEDGEGLEDGTPGEDGEDEDQTGEDNDNNEDEVIEEDPEEEIDVEVETI